jgi:hypothetical protein
LSNIQFVVKQFLGGGVAAQRKWKFHSIHPRKGLPMRSPIGLFLLLVAAALPGFAAEMSIGTNFTVMAPNRSVAEAVAARAETYRRQAAQEWLSAKLSDGRGPTLITVEISSQKDEALTWPIDCPERKLHHVWLTTSTERAVGSTLHHEVVHTVLDTHFYPDAPPAWASEGIASQADDTGRQQNQSQILRRWSQSGHWPNVMELFTSPQIGHNDLDAYAASSSVTQFLAARGGKPRVVEFAAAGPKRGWDQAAHDCYGFHDVADLQSAWQSWVEQRLER